MATNYHIVDSFFSFTSEKPNGVRAVNAVLVAPPTLEQFKWIWSGSSVGWVEATEEYLVNYFRPIKRKETDESRARLEAAGVPYEFPDTPGVTSTVQTKELDIRNILAVVVTAQTLAAQGITDPVVPFRDFENVTHMLTPTQAVQMGMYVQQQIQVIYQASWDAKAALDAATTLVELNAVDTSLSS